VACTNRYVICKFSGDMLANVARVPFVPNPVDGVRFHSDVVANLWHRASLFQDLRKSRTKRAFRAPAIFLTGILLTLFGFLLTGALQNAAAADVLTQHNDNARTGANLGETVLTTASVKPDTFGLLWTLYVDGQIVAQPLYVSQLRIDTSTNPSAPLVQGTFNAVVVATMHNTVYVYDADAENRLPDGRTKPLWATWLGQPRVSGADIDMFATNDPEWGIVATPVIDPQKSTVWVVAWHDDGGTMRYRLHSLNVKDGSQRRPPVVIGGDPPDPAKPCAYPNGFNPCKQKQRAALLLDKAVIYVAFGGDGNRGSLFAFDAATLQQRASWSPTPTGSNGGIWQSGQGPAADQDGNVYLMIANGTFDANTGGPNYGQSFVKLRLDNGSFTVKDYFTPCDQEFLSSVDLDLGSGGPVLIPGTNLVFGGGKKGFLYVVSRNNMGKYAASPLAPNCKNPNAIQEFQASELHMHGAGTSFGHIHGSPVFWKGPDKSRAYVWGETDRLKAFTFEQGKFTGVSAPTTSTFAAPPLSMPGGMLSVSSNGAKPGSGIVWAVVPFDGDANKARGVQGILLALDAQNVTRQLWTSELSGARDRLGLFAKFVAPTIAGGKVFVATYGDKEPNVRPPQPPAHYYVAVYGLLPHQHPKPIVNQMRDDVSVTAATAITAVALDSSTCRPVDAGNVDCTAALSQQFGAPSLHTVIVPSGYDFAGCNLLRVTTASKQSGLATATGIGWYSADATSGAQAMTSGRFVTTAELKQVGTATFKSGAPAILHEFVGVANCPAGQVSFDKLFKPYVQFENAPDGKIYRNWDVAQNYRISRGTPRFDRSADVLAP
jgi:hypothetical protein